MKQLSNQVEATSELQRFLNKNSEIKQDISLPQKHFLSYSFPLLIFGKKKKLQIGKLEIGSKIQISDRISRNPIGNWNFRSEKGNSDRNFNGSNRTCSPFFMHFSILILFSYDLLKFNCMQVN